MTIQISSKKYPGRVMQIDDEMLYLFKGKKVGYRNGYARVVIGRKSYFAHRIILDAKRGDIVDHINGNPLDNRRNNLRFCTHAENLRNSRTDKTQKTFKGNPCRSKYKGVFRDKKNWVAIIKFNYKAIHIGNYPTQEEAAIAYDIKAVELFGDFARVNFPERISH